MLSQSEENYLKAIFNLSQSDDRVSTNNIAEALNTKPSSVTDMMQKLSEKGLIDYVKYQGVCLTVEGRNRAISIIRNSRLWEVFLVEKLGYAWDEVHAIAEQLEHVHSDSLVDRLDAYLNFPTKDPHGDPIPDKKGRILAHRNELLSSLEQGDHCSIVGVKDSSSAFLKYLDRQQITLGTELCVRHVEEFDQSMIIEKSGKTFSVSHQTAQNIFVKKL